MSGISHKWNGTILTVTSDSGTSSADLKGEKGDTGIRGAQGPAGGAINDVSLMDKTLTIENYAADAKAVGDRLAAMKSASKIVNTVGAEHINVDDASDNPLEGLRIYGKTIQDGVPLPDAPRGLQPLGRMDEVLLFDDFNDNDITDWQQHSVYKGKCYGENGKLAITLDKGEQLIIYKDFTPVTSGKLIVEWDYLVNRNNNPIFEPGITMIDKKNNWLLCVGAKYAAFTVWEGGEEVYISNKECEDGKTYKVKLEIFIEASQYNLYVDEEKIISNHKLISDATAIYRLWIDVKGVTTENSATAYFDNLKITKGGAITVTSVGNVYDDRKIVVAYTPYGLHGIQVESSGNYTDINNIQWVGDVIDIGKGKYIQRIGYIKPKKVLSSFNSIYGDKCFVVANDAKETNPANMGAVMCSHAVAATANNQYTKVRNSVSLSAKTVLLCFDGIKTNEQAEEFLANNDITVIYELNTPIEIPLTSQELLAYAAMHSYKPTTAIYNDAGAYLSADYVADTKTYIDNKFNELSNTILSLGGAS